MGLEIYYSGCEAWWFPSDIACVIHASHESSITLAGEGLVTAFRRMVPDCVLYDYAGPFATPDRRGTWDPL